MKTRAGLLLTSALTLLSLSFTSSAFAKDDKVDVCHTTGSATNPGVLLNVSVKAAAVHIGHGDTVDFDVLPSGSCVADSEPPPVTITVTACSKLDSLATTYSWDVVYDPATGVFNGSALGGASVITGTVSPAGDILAGGQFVDYTADGFHGVSSEPSYKTNTTPGAPQAVYGAYFDAEKFDSDGGADILFVPAGVACLLPVPR